MQQMKRLELESILSQIRDNNNVYDGPFCSFSFNHINFILINDIYYYTDCAKFDFQIEYLSITGDKINTEVKYSNIDNILINFRENNDV